MNTIGATPLQNGSEQLQGQEKCWDLAPPVTGERHRDHRQGKAKKKAECDQLRKALQSAEDEVCRFQKLLDNWQQEAEDEKQQLMYALKVVKDGKDGLRRYYVEEIRQQQATFENEIEDLSQTYKAAYRELESQHCKLKEKYSHLEEEKTRLHGDNQILVEHQKQQMAELREELTTKLNAANQEVWHLQEQSSHLEKKKARLHADNQILSQRHQADIQELQSHLGKVKEKLSHIDTEKDALQANNQMLVQRQVQQLESLHTEWSVKLQTAN